MKSVQHAIILASVFLIFGVSLSSAEGSRGGGGGLFLGQSIFVFPGLSYDPADLPDLTLMYKGGEGYAINEAGEITGGFGIQISDIHEEDLVEGVFGGMVFGQVGNLGALFVANTNRIGIGWMSISPLVEPLISTGSLRAFSEVPIGTIFGQIELEVGLTILPWFRVSATGGVTGLLGVESIPRAVSFLYFPYYGLRVMFGGFPK